MSTTIDAPDAGETSQMFSAMVVPTNAVGDDYPVFVIPIDADPLPLSPLVSGRLQHAFNAGCAVYIISANETVLQRVLCVLQMLADTGEGSTAQ